jgi:hypothetical protein
VVDGTENGFPADKNVCVAYMKLNQDSPIDDYKEVPKLHDNGY